MCKSILTILLCELESIEIMLNPPETLAIQGGVEESHLTIVAPANQERGRVSSPSICQIHLTNKGITTHQWMQWVGPYEERHGHLFFTKLSMLKCRNVLIDPPFFHTTERLIPLNMSVTTSRWCYYTVKTMPLCARYFLSASDPWLWDDSMDWGRGRFIILVN